MEWIYLPFSSVNCATVEVWKWISNFIPHFTWVCDYLSMPRLVETHKPREFGGIDNNIIHYCWCARIDIFRYIKSFMASLPELYNFQIPFYGRRLGNVWFIYPTWKWIQWCSECWFGSVMWDKRGEFHIAMSMATWTRPSNSLSVHRSFNFL